MVPLPSRPPAARPAAKASPLARSAGLVLLEVLISLSIFVFAAAVVGAGLRSTLDAAMDIREAGKAANLAQSVLAELSAGGLELTNAEPTAFAAGEEEADSPEKGWTYEIAVEDIPGTPGLKRVTIIVRNDNGLRPRTCRLTQWMLDPNAGVGQAEEALP